MKSDLEYLSLRGNPRLKTWNARKPEDIIIKINFKCYQLGDNNLVQIMRDQRLASAYI